MTARRVAIRRAAHQTLDPPPVFIDPVGARLLEGDDQRRLEDALRAGKDAPGKRLRAFVAARSRYAEDELAAAVSRGVSQYVVLGAGLDTFAYRNAFPRGALGVFEVDFPTTQAWKRRRLAEAGVAVPENLRFAPVDFETGTLADGLERTGFSRARPAFFSWLGVVPYLEASTVMDTLAFVAGLPAGSAIVLDYGVPLSMVSERVRAAFLALANRVELAGEPFKTFFDPATLAADLVRLGFHRVDDLGPDEINARYFANRSDDLCVGGIGRLLQAVV